MERGITHFPADDGEELFVQVTGNGPPVVLLHEWGSSHRVWEPIAHRLIDRYTVYRWDARGHAGHRPGPGRPVTITRIAHDLANLLDHFGLSRPVVVGHSMGALALWAYIGRYGCGRLRRIGIIDQSPKLTTDDGWPCGIYGDWPVARDERFVAAMRRNFVEAVIELISFGLNAAARRRYETRHPSLARLRTYLSMLNPQPLIEVWHTLARADFRPVLPRISVPALLVYGAESNYYPPATGVFVRDQIPRAELVVYEGADHSPHAGQPERFATDLARFIEAD